MESYSYEKKKRMAETISKLKKNDMREILKIIYEDNKNITENQNGLFMLFNKLDNGTYCKIDNYLKSIKKKKYNTQSTSENKTYDENSSIEYDQLDPKLKYSNKEKNIIKRQRYDSQLNSENNSDSRIIYKKFDVNILSDSDNISLDIESKII
jgi:hypothetical protein